MPFGAVGIRVDLGFIILVIGLVLLTLYVAYYVVYIAYYGVQSLKQATLLAKPIPIRRLGFCDGQALAVYGRPRKYDGEDYGFGLECVWMQITWQEFRSDGDVSGWETTNVETKAYKFLLEDGQGNTVLILNDATEVHGTEKTSWEGTDSHRKKRKYLPFAESFTVVGRAVAGKSKDSYSIVKDSKVGMLLSSANPDKQAKSEKLKGRLSVILVILLWIALAVYSFVH
jgi:hypothetical protein